MITRRKFIGTLATSAAAGAVASSALGAALNTTAASYARIIGANDRLNFGIIGLNGRAGAHLSSLAANKDAAHISHVCDVETNILAKFAAATQ